MAKKEKTLYVAEKVWVNEKEQQLFIWLATNKVKDIQVFTKGGKYYKISLK